MRSNGEIKWGGRLVPIACALVGEAVAIEETEAATGWSASTPARSPRSTEAPSARAVSTAAADTEPSPTHNPENCQPCIRSKLSTMHPLDTRSGLMRGMFYVGQIAGPLANRHRADLRRI